MDRDLRPYNCIADIKWFSTKNSISEIGQPLCLKFAFVNENLEQTHPLIKCRDFLHDVVKSYLTKSKISLYNFDYDPNKNPPLYPNRTLMLVEFPGDISPKVNSIQTLLHCVEYALNLKDMKNNKKTSVYNIVNVKDDKKYLLFSSPKIWMCSPFLLSLYTLLIKIGQHDDENILKSDGTSKLNVVVNKFIPDLLSKKKDAPNTEIRYLKSIEMYFSGIIDNYESLISLDKSGFDRVYYESISINQFHNNYGIVGLVNGSYKNLPAEKIKKVCLQSEKKEGLPVSLNNELQELNSYISEKLDAKNPYGPMFAFVSKIDDQSRCLTTNLVADRTLLAFAMKEKIMQSAPKGGNKKPNNPAVENIDLDKLRLLISFDNASFPESKDKAFKAKKIINTLENGMGLKERTKISTAHLDFKDTYGTKTFYLLTGPNIWLRSPYLFYIFTTIMAGFSTFDYKIAKKDMNERSKTIEGIKGLMGMLCDEHTNKDMTMAIHNISNKIDYIISNLDSFIENTMVENYKELTNLKDGFNKLKVEDKKEQDKQKSVKK